VEEISITIMLLAAAGAFLTGVTVLLRTVRDWNADKYAAKARAEGDKALRDYYRALAKLARVQADILAWFFSEAKKGRWHVAADRLLQVVFRAQPTPIESQQPEPSELGVTIELPTGTQTEPPPVGPLSKAS
jgi:hypothetical protein